MKHATVSILLPVRNGAFTIEAAIESILRQSYSSWELIVIDDGSTDQTTDFLCQFATKDSRIKPVKTPPRGIASALNMGLAFANGNFIARMDADDFCHPDRIRLQVEHLQKNTDCDLVSCLVDYGGNRIENEGYYTYVQWINSLINHNDIYINRFIESPLAHPSVMFRWELIDKYGGWKDGNFPEDYELWLRWLEKGVIMEKIPEKLLTWNDFSDRLSRTDERYENIAFYRIKADYISRWLKKYKSNKRIWSWGAGKTSRKRALLLENHDLEIDAWIDIDQTKIAKRLNGKPVHSIDKLPPPGEVFIVSYIANRGARNRIREFLNNLMWEEEKDYIICA